MKSFSAPYILIADIDKEFTKSLIAEHNSTQYKIEIAETGKDAQLFISDKKESLYGIFVSPSISQPSGLSVIKSAMAHRPATPLYMLIDKEIKLDVSHQNLKKMGVRSIFQKPIKLKDMVDMLSPILIHFDAHSALEASKNNLEEVDTEIQSPDPSFVPIRAEDFLSGSKSFFDVYVKLSSGRYLKLLKSGDSFTPERLTAYLNKGISHFYIKREIQQIYLQYCDHITSALLGKNNVSLEVKTSQTLNQGEETFKFLQAQGISEVNLNYASKFIKNVSLLAQQLVLNTEDVFQKFLSNLAAYEHASGTSAIASILIKELEIQMDQPVQIVGLACLLHDIGLFQLPLDIQHEDESKMNKDQLAQYKTHPALGAEIIKKLRGVHPTVPQAVEQHHIRINGRGFPENRINLKINRVSEIVGISDEFQKLIQKKATIGDSSNIQAEVERDILPSFSRQIAYAFRSAFFSNRN